MKKLLLVVVATLVSGSLMAKMGFGSAPKTGKELALECVEIAEKQRDDLLDFMAKFNTELIVGKTKLFKAGNKKLAGFFEENINTFENIGSDSSQKDNFLKARAQKAVMILKSNIANFEKFLAHLAKMREEGRKKLEAQEKILTKFEAQF